MEEKPAYIVDLSAETSAAIGRLVARLGNERVILLAELIDTVIESTGYGDVIVVVADERVVGLRHSVSHR